MMYLALALTLILYAVRKLPGLSFLWNKIPDGWRWLFPLVAGALTQVIPLVSSSGSFAELGQALLTGAGVGLTAMGIHAAVKESPIPIDGGPGGRSLPKIGPVALVLLVLALGGCASIKPALRTASDVAHDACLVVMSERPEVLADAKVKGISGQQAAEVLCAANDVLRPFLVGMQNAGEQAVGNARSVGMIR